MKKIKKFLWPNRGILGIFLVWTALAMIDLTITLMSYILIDWTVVLESVAINLIVIYFFSCLSAWAYERMKGKKVSGVRVRKRRR